MRRWSRCQSRLHITRVSRIAASAIREGGQGVLPHINPEVRSVDVMTLYELHPTPLFSCG